ncbi:hypothetical protein A2890_02820 [candidate division WWE3 bacterium RIFCSPLOWO2_01_FULL_53_14]|uniref:Uncharacterized protein n=1 Tax=candidate division WWE3 bacterium RIFCSPLOWO2_01_FULL_53_14 TaxID=1802628 RepID=A0A1F4VS30_UNCKA|nr:MAG: hypothetical protein A2890_02820 [candidate division WWE3 bacterium RIFCSPLOWO2_01_FULL_53_14]
MKKLLFGALLLFVIAGCATNQEAARLHSVRATVDQCKQSATDPSNGILPGERPDFDFRNQVLSPEELVVGEVYVFCHLPDGSSSVYVLASEPYEVEVNGLLNVLRIDVRDWDSGWPSQLYLGDMGVTPYSTTSGDIWNPANVLLRVLPTYIVDWHPW